MNAIQQISLKLQMGLDPATHIHPARLRAMWSERGQQQPQHNDSRRTSSGGTTLPDLQR